jgi:YVTN family beta-propeller protein
VVANLTGFDFPYGVTYDPGTGDIFVSNWESGSVTVISDGTSAAIGSVSGGDGPYTMAYDPAMSELFLVNAGGTVVVISDGPT